MPKLFWIGVAVLALGSGPLIAIMLATILGLTSHPNPVGFGILAGVTFWPGVAMTAIGILQLVRRGSGK